jgi:hypothetical protein
LPAKIHERQKEAFVLMSLSLKFEVLAPRVKFLRPKTEVLNNYIFNELEIIDFLEAKPAKKFQNPQSQDWPAIDRTFF